VRARAATPGVSSSAIRKGEGAEREIEWGILGSRSWFGVLGSAQIRRGRGKLENEGRALCCRWGGKGTIPSDGRVGKKNEKAGGRWE
jgi:hypothetical protein